MAIPNHPAKFNLAVLMKIAPYLPHTAGATILDPFAGVGGVFKLHSMGFRGKIVGIEIEPDWAMAHPGIQIGDALSLPFEDEHFDAIVTSPVYGNRMSDHHKAKDGSKRTTYAHSIGHDLQPNNAGAMQWGGKYRDFHVAAWTEACRVLKPGGLFFLNVKDHVRGGQRQEVSLWHMATLVGLGLESLHTDQVYITGNGYGENRDARVPYEYVFRLEKPQGGEVSARRGMAPMHAGR